MSDRYNTERAEKWRTLLIALALIVAVSLLAVWITSGAISAKRIREIKRRLICSTRLHQVGQALAIYSEKHGGGYPASEKWCDLLVQNVDVSNEAFECPGNKGARCSYAFNPNADPNGPPDLVLLFETKGGWNQCGGAELLTLENHGGEGCNVLFNDGHVKFVKAARIGELKWEVWEEAAESAEK